MVAHTGPTLTNFVQRAPLWDGQKSDQDRNQEEWHARVFSFPLYEQDKCEHSVLCTMVCHSFLEVIPRRLAASECISTREPCGDYNGCCSSNHVHCVHLSGPH